MKADLEVLITMDPGTPEYRVLLQTLQETASVNTRALLGFGKQLRDETDPE